MTERQALRVRGMPRALISTVFLFRALMAAPLSRSFIASTWKTAVTNNVTPTARNVVRSVFKARAHPAFGMSTQDIYRFVHEDFPSADDGAPSAPPATATATTSGKKPKRVGRHMRPPLESPKPPHPNHPIQSMRYALDSVYAFPNSILIDPPMVSDT